jgi:hypothetical protein
MAKPNFTNVNTGISMEEKLAIQFSWLRRIKLAA